MIVEGLPSAAEIRRTRARALLVFRWAAIVWIVALAASDVRALSRPRLAWAAVAAAAAWTAWLAPPSRQERPGALWGDLAICTGLILVSGLVVAPGQIVSRPFFATAYPMSAAIAWGFARGPGGGLVAGAALGAAVAFSRPLNGMELGELSLEGVQRIANGAIGYLLAGGAVGAFSQLLDRAARAAEEATTQMLHERERAARLKERESLARQIHDSVLQALALVHKRGREIAASGSASPSDVAALAEIAGSQEVALRSLILREPEDRPIGQASLREMLEAAVLGIDAVPVTVTSVGPVWLPRHQAEEIAAAVREALANVVEHAGASRVSVFSEEEDGIVVVTVRDDGSGFVYDEARLQSQGKAGVLQSMKGRMKDIGGTMLLSSAPGRGTEVEFRLSTAPEPGGVP